MNRLLIRKLAVTAGAVAVLPFLATAANAAAGAGGPTPIVVPDSAVTPTTLALGGAKVLPTTRTVAHWHGTANNPVDGVTYGFNMVGADPSANQSTTITTDIVPVNVNVGGLTFNGTDVVIPILNSPQFTNQDYSSTPWVTSSAGGFTAGGTLSPISTSNQLEDATMRSQFDQGGNYHVILNPVVHDPITLDVPANHGTLLQTGRGVVAGDVDVQWWASHLQNLNNSVSFTDPTHLVLYVTDNVMLYGANNPADCCIIGFHSASEVNGHGLGSTHSNGNAQVQTYAWASYITPGFFNPSSGWAVQDIHALSHEIAEWGDDPFVNNTVLPWLTPTAPQYGCTGILETGDPVVGIGFAKGTNTFRQGPTPNGTQVADGYYHPEDEVFMPWFMRLSPSPSETGRYTLMGNLNPYPGFKQPATGC